LFVAEKSGVKKIVAPPPLAPPIVVSTTLKEDEGVKKFILTGFVRRWSWKCYLCRAENSRYVDKCANCKRRKEIKFARMWLEKKKKV
jgi:7-cyano-7-deazaguanine synthase in queuosine biosynthesis